MKKTISSSDFLKRLLKDCIGTVMFEISHWDFPNEDFERAYFNDRIKKEKSINALTRKRLLYVFSLLFQPQNQNRKFGEAQAVDGANALISLLHDLFLVDFTFLKNEHGKDNKSKRKILLEILETVLNIAQDISNLNHERITNALLSIQDELVHVPDSPTIEYPFFLTLPPSASTEHFVGRQNICNEIADMLCSGISCFLHGIGGIGKTEIAKDVIRKIKNTPSDTSKITHIAWIDYIENNLGLSLIRGFGISKNQSNYDRALQSVCNLIEQHGDRLLLVIDNVENTEDENLLKVSSFLSCRLLISSRMDGLSNLKKIPVNELLYKDCKDLFYYYYSLRHDEHSLQKILELADRHTVTVELLAKIADTEEVALIDFLQNLIECGFSLSEEEASSVHGKLNSEDRIIEQLKKLFNIYGCTESETQLLIKISAIPSLPFDFSKARAWFDLKNRTDINRLTKKGWLNKTAQYGDYKYRYMYTIHSVIAAAIRAQFIDVLYSACHDFIIKLTKEMGEIREQNVSIKKELTQFSWSINDLFHNDFCQEKDTEFLWAIAEIYGDIGYFSRAIIILSQLLDMCNSLYGNECSPSASVHNSLGLIYYEIAQFKSSLEEYNLCLKICSSFHDSNCDGSKEKTDIGVLNLNIGKVYLKIDYVKAKPYLESAYHILSEVLGKTAYKTLNALAHWGSFMVHDGKLKEAEEIFLKIYSSIDKNSSLLDERMLYAGVAHYLGDLYSDASPQKALPYLEEARTIQISSLSPTHPDTLDTLNSIANCHLTLADNPTSTLHEFQDLLLLMKKVYGHSDPNVAAIYNNIGLCHYYLGQISEALVHYSKAINIYDYAYQPDHEHSAYIYNNMGAALLDDNRPLEAVSQHLHALKIYQSSYKTPNHLDVAQTHIDLADAFLRTGNIDDTYLHLNKVFEIYEHMCIDKKSLKYASAYTTLSSLYITEKCFSDAISCIHQACEILIYNGFSENSDTVKELVNRINELNEIN